jgi:arsenate reductase-like glutaredoxin family protein
MDVQIFGVKKNAETRKALRFFAERRIKTHFVDLMERAASRVRAHALRTEVRRDRHSSTRRPGAKASSACAPARYGDERWLEVLVRRTIDPEDATRPIRKRPFDRRGGGDVERVVGDVRSAAARHAAS